MSYVSKVELAEAMADVRAEMAEMETRLRTEWTDALRFWFENVDQHLRDQDGKINWILGLIVTILIAVVGALIYVAAA